MLWKTNFLSKHIPNTNDKIQSRNRKFRNYADNIQSKLELEAADKGEVKNENLILNKLLFLKESLIKCFLS